MGSKSTTVGNTSSSGSATSNLSGSSTGGFSSPIATGFLNQLFPQIQKGIDTANQPVYGDAQKASYLGGLDQLANASIESLKQNLARAGALTSGRFSQGATDIGMNRNSKAADFFSQIPLLNRQQKMADLSRMFGAGESALSVAPRTSSMTQSGQNTSNQQGQSSQTTSSPWWSGLGAGLLNAGLNAFTGLPFMSGGGGASAPAFDPSGLPGYGAPAIGGAATGGGLGAGMPSWLAALQPNNLPFG